MLSALENIKGFQNKRILNRLCNLEMMVSRIYILRVANSTEGSFSKMNSVHVYVSQNLNELWQPWGTSANIQGNLVK